MSARARSLQYGIMPAIKDYIPTHVIRGHSWTNLCCHSPIKLSESEDGGYNFGDAGWASKPTITAERMTYL